jgi:hypothetical protein
MLLSVLYLRVRWSLASRNLFSGKMPIGSQLAIKMYTEVIEATHTCRYWDYTVVAPDVWRLRIPGCRCSVLL